MSLARSHVVGCRRVRLTYTGLEIWGFESIEEGGIPDSSLLNTASLAISPGAETQCCAEFGTHGGGEAMFFWFIVSNRRSQPGRELIGVGKGQVRGKCVKQDTVELGSLVVSTVVSLGFVDEIAVLSAVLAELGARDARLREGGWLVLGWMRWRDSRGVLVQKHRRTEIAG
jgi:hypothetical protein